MARIVYPDADRSHLDLLEGRIKPRIEALGSYALFEGEPETDAVWVERVGEAEAILLGWALPDAVLERAPNLKLVSFTGIGAGNHVNLGLAAERGIRVANTPGYANDTVAEHALGLMLACARLIPFADRAVRAGGWRGDWQGFDLKGKTLGLVGLGGIGACTATLARAFGMRVIAWTRNPSAERGRDAGVEFVDLDDLLAESDVVSLHLALTAETERLIGAERLAAMKPHAILVNTARGEIVDQDALVEALAAGRIGGAGLDVFAPEPLPEDHPLRRLENVVLTPHTAFNTPEANEAILDIALGNVEAWAAGRPVNVMSA